MKITSVSSDNRRRRFDVSTRRGRFGFPYAKSDPTPSSADPIVELLVDPELGREGFTYRLASGVEGSVHVDSVLEYNEEPGYMADLALYRLSREAAKRFEESTLGVRELAAVLHTSPAQLYRLVDPTNTTKSMHQLLMLLAALGYEVDFQVRPKAKRRAAG